MELANLTNPMNSPGCTVSRTACFRFDNASGAQWFQVIWKNLMTMVKPQQRLSLMYSIDFNGAKSNGYDSTKLLDAV